MGDDCAMCGGMVYDLEYVGGQGYEELLPRHGVGLRMMYVEYRRFSAPDAL